jgi:hypothetical protein
MILYGTDLRSLSEYGCIKNTRNWEETTALYSDKMTAVYSGGLAYEYSMEDNGYGMVTINGDSIQEGPSFQTYQKALAATANPSGDGGYNPNSAKSDCPAKSSTWNVTGSALPAIPDNAKAFMTNGAGKGVGLSGPGSQDAAGSGTSTTTAAPGSGSVTVTASPSATKKSAASISRPNDNSAMIVGTIVLGFALFGGMLL